MKIAVITKRGIAGNLVFISFNRDALLAELGDKTISKYKANDSAWLKDQQAAQFISIEQWDVYMSNLANPNGANGEAGIVGNTNNLVTDEAKPKYADEILPFDITISLANEYGNKAVTVIYGVEILNEGTENEVREEFEYVVDTYKCPMCGHEVEDYMEDEE